MTTSVKGEQKGEQTGEHTNAQTDTGWIKGTVVNTRHWTDNLFSLQIAADITPGRAGQYTLLGVDLDGERVSQPYSLLSAPGEQPLEFFFYTQEEGDLSRALSRSQPDDTLWVQQQPEGTLTLNHVPDTDLLCLMATGTGVAPFIAMLKTDEPWQRFKHVALIYAVREAADLCYRDLFNGLRRRYPGRFTLVPFVSREQTEGAIHGRIPAALLNGKLEAALGQTLSAERSHVMLCGNPGMVQDASQILSQRGFQTHSASQPGQLSYESYW